MSDMAALHHDPDDHRAQNKQAETDRSRKTDRASPPAADFAQGTKIGHQLGMRAIQPVKPQLARNLWLGAEPFSFCQARRRVAQLARQGTAATTQHHRKGWLLSAARTAETCLDQAGNLVSHWLDIGIGDCVAFHVAMIDAMALGFQTS